MKMLLDVRIPHAPFNAAVRAGTADATLKRILDETKPEAVYFTEHGGRRGAVLLVEVSDPSRVPALAEPWFLAFEADCRFRIVMSPDELAAAGLDQIAERWATR